MSRMPVIPSLLVGLCCLEAHAHNRCDPHSVRGTYAVSYEGSVYQFTEEGPPATVPLPVVCPQTMKVKFAGSVSLRSDCTLPPAGNAWNLGAACDFGRAARSRLLISIHALPLGGTCDREYL